LIQIYPLPPKLPQNPYLDQLYSPMHYHDIAVDRSRPRYGLLGLLFRRGNRILHLHFFDELLQKPSARQTTLRSAMFVIFLQIMQLVGVRLVWTAHNLEAHELHHPEIGRRVYRYVAKHAKAIIFHSHAAQQLFEQRYGACPQARVIPIGNYIGLYGPQQERTISRQRLGLPLDGPVLVCVGAIRPYKNIEGLIDAFAQLPAATRGTLLIAGAAKTADYAAELQRRADGIAGLRLDLRYIADAELPYYFAAADLVVLPYRKMLTSAMLICAMSYASAVLAPAFAPVRELVEHGVNGWLFDPAEPQALQQALAHVINQPQAEIAQAAFARAQQFDWADISAQTARCYREVSNATQ
jgi:beta-1,4-mannosyltransferase